MAATSDQIQAEIERTRARMEMRLDAVAPTGPTGPSALSNLTTSIKQQVQQRPLVALGLSLAAGSLLSSRLSGGQAASGSTSSNGAAAKVSGAASGAASTVSGTVSQAGSTVADTASSAASATTDAAKSAGQTVTSAASTAADTATSAASTAAQTASDAASATGQAVQSAGQTVADTASSAVSSVVGAVQSAAQTATGAVQQATSSAGNAVGSSTPSTSGPSVPLTERIAAFFRQLAARVRSLRASAMQQVQQRPLASIGVAMGAGAATQPAAAPQVQKVTTAVTTQAAALGTSVTAALQVAPPNPQEVDRIRQALVPATVEKVQLFTSRDLRNYLDNGLSGIISQTALRGGVVAAITERAEGLAQNRLPTVLDRSLTGTRGLLLSALIARVLQARNEAQQGQGQTLSNLTKGVSQATLTTTTENLQRFFPEFRERYQASQQ